MLKVWPKPAQVKPGFWPYPQTLDLAEKACQIKTLKLFTNFNEYRGIRFFNIGPR